MCAGMCVMGLFHSEWLKPMGVEAGALIALRTLQSADVVKSER